MTSTSSEVILPGEIELFIESIHPSILEELGSIQWLPMHGRFQKINQQAVLEANRLKEELVKDTLILREKVPVVVYEVICSSLWRQNILPEMIKISPDPKNTFLAYTILYHEATAVGLLETVLFHEESCEALGDSVIDLIDYCMQSVAYCISRKEVDPVSSKVENIKGGDFLVLEQHRLRFDNGIRSISILRCLAEFLNSLPLSATNRLFETHDLPLLFVELIENPPWLLKDSSGNRRIYKDGKWLTKEETKLHENGSLLKIEGQIWIGLIVLLLGEKCQMHYEINNARKNRLLKLQRHLHEELLDQLSPLVDLKKWLSHLSISSPPVISNPIVLEIVPEITEGLLKKYSKKWKKIADMHAKTLFDPVKGDLQEIAKSLSDAYDLSALGSLLPNDSMCANGCGTKGVKRCSRCKVEWYCGRECQVSHWSKHKTTCDLLAQIKENQ